MILMIKTNKMINQKHIVQKKIKVTEKIQI